jgi:large subunit ribosomal protein L18e
MMFGTFYFALDRGLVADDTSLLEVPKVTVAALRFTRTVRARILNAGGECLTLDELAMV